jgi:hypothetical protein
VRLLETLLYFFAYAADDPIMESANEIHTTLRSVLRLQTNVCDERIPYATLRATSTFIIADSNAGFPTTKHDWCGMGASLQSYAQYSHVQELNRERVLNFAGARLQLGPVLSTLDESATFHIFWSPGGGGGRLSSPLGEHIVTMKDIVNCIIGRGHIPYVCLDMAAIREMERENRNNGLMAMINELKGFGALVETTDAFWTERIQLQKMWDPVTGTARMTSSEDDKNAMVGSLDASTSSEEQPWIHFDPRSMTIPQELVPLCNLYDRHTSAEGCHQAQFASSGSLWNQDHLW